MMNQMSSMVGPMSRRKMEFPRVSTWSAAWECCDREVRRPRKTARAWVAEQTMANSPLKAENPMGHQDMPDMQPQGMQMGKPDVSKDANSVPGFPQDAFMEGPAMAMDQMVDKPENFGLRPGWSGFMAGMMSFVRVLPPDKYDKIMELRKKQEGNKPMKMDMPGMEHKHE
jgi:hypothetical protein